MAIVFQIHTREFSVGLGIWAMLKPSRTFEKVRTAANRPNCKLLVVIPQVSNSYVVRTDQIDTEGRRSLPPTLTVPANSRSQDLDLPCGTPQKPVADKNVIGLQVDVSSTKRVCSARLTWS